MSLGLFLFFIFVLAANLVIGYIIAVLLGIGPSDFRTAWTIIKSSIRQPPFLHTIRELREHRSNSILARLTAFFATLVGRMKILSHRSQEEPASLAESPEGRDETAHGMK